MICLRCGRCCVDYLVTIVRPESVNKKWAEMTALDFTNLKGVCPHLNIEYEGTSCSIHNKEWYDKTPCYAHTQIEVKNSPCRLGEFSIKDETWRKKLLTYFAV